MEKTLGIDIGTNSIGACLRNPNKKENQFKYCSVITFDKGVADEKGAEKPMVKERTEARGKRRNYQAEKYRKWELLQLLIEKGWCPLRKEELSEWKHYKKGVGRKYPQSEKFIQWLRFDFNGDGKPDFEEFGFSKHESYYLFRMLIVSDEPKHKKLFQDNPQILGRVLYQLVQRRGFRGKDEEEAKTMLEGSKTNATKGRNEIATFIEQYGTLGAALYHLQKEKNERIRKRYNLRTDYEAELKCICEVQEIDDATYKKLWKAVIWQRPLRSQKGLVGYCTFQFPIKLTDEKYIGGKKRCPISHPAYEEYRTWVFLNNLKIVLPEGLERQQYLSEKILPLFYHASNDFKLSSIVKQLKKDGGGIASRFKYGASEAEKKKEEKNLSDTKVLSCKLMNSFKELFGNDWHNYNKETDEIRRNYKKDGSFKEYKKSYNINDVWHVLFTFDSKEKLKEFATQKLQLDAEKAEKFSKIKLQQGYATLSLSAIEKILPYLKQGYIYSHAVYFANLPKVLGGKAFDEGAIKMFSQELQSIFKKDNKDRLIIQVINGLISDVLNSSYRHGMDENYQLDKDDEKDISKKINDIIGEKTWLLWTEEERKETVAFVKEKYLKFLKKPIQFSKEKIFLKNERLHDKVFAYLKDTYSLPDENKKYLWHPSEQENYTVAEVYHKYSVNEKEVFVAERNIEKFLAKNPTAINEYFSLPLLGDPQPISKGFKNPMALKSLHKLKGYLNYMLRTGKIDEDTRVVVEIAREMNDANRRKAIERWQRDREKENTSFKEKIAEMLEGCGLGGTPITQTMLDRYRLWVEQNHLCLYTGKIIDFCDMIIPGMYDLEHTIPASMSFDNELKNLTLADGNYNKNVKKKRMPTELQNYEQDATIDGKTYTAIKPRIEFMENKVEDLEKLLKEWILKTKYASTKDIKDACIQRRHYIKMDLDYWRKKLDTFTIKEYKVGWRNSQLRDTQIITKYALPYLKTVFKKVEVQKASVVDAFKEIYKVKFKDEEKDRSYHSHHAEDAAILTLIPPAATRDKILEKYNAAKDINYYNTYHEQPRAWEGFQPEDVLRIKESLLVNYSPEYRATKETYKKVRKRGKQEYVCYKDKAGKWQYKLDKEGKKIPKIAQGETIRGNLHDDTFFAKTKFPEYEERSGKFIPQTDGKGNFIFQKNEKRGDDFFFTSRHLQGLSYFKSLSDLDLIVDPNLRDYLKKEIQLRMQNKVLSFEKAMQEPIWAFGKTKDKHGKPLSPIRHIRTQIKGGGGLVTNPATINNFAAFQSKKEYKQQKYALNGSIYACAFYQGMAGEELVRQLQIISLLEVADAKRLRFDSGLFPNNIIYTKKKQEYLIPLYEVLKSGMKVVFYENEISELEELSQKEIAKRLYTIGNFEEGTVYLKHHLNAMNPEMLKQNLESLEVSNKGGSSFSTEKIIPKLRLTKGALNFAIEGKHFEIMPDGEIKWK